MVSPEVVERLEWLRKQYGDDTKSYFALGIAVRATEKQVAQKVKSKVRHGATPRHDFHCPECMSLLCKHSKYCPDCGQALKWRETK